LSEQQAIYVKPVWATPNGEELVAHMARVSSPENEGKDANKLIKYLIKNDHWSPFEMVNMVVEIGTTRDIARQLLRHRSFTFQEFSQRYASVDKLPVPPIREARLQDTKNRQSSLPCGDSELAEEWVYQQDALRQDALRVYQWALDNGIAKEVARCVLPEGLTMSRMYMNGTLRSWLHFIKLRTGNGTQLETQQVATLIAKDVEKLFPVSYKALLDEH
jgi:thymidylate synthase (FAD)